MARTSLKRLTHFERLSTSSSKIEPLLIFDLAAGKYKPDGRRRGGARLLCVIFGRGSPLLLSTLSRNLAQVAVNSG